MSAVGTQCAASDHCRAILGEEYCAKLIELIAGWMANVLIRARGERIPLSLACSVLWHSICVHLNPLRILHGFQPASSVDTTCGT